MTNHSKVYFLPYLDGLRGLAALTVFVGHLVAAFYFTLKVKVVSVSATTSLSASLPITSVARWSMPDVANASVCIFFALSGYVMSVLSSRSQESILAISIRRYLRLAGPAMVSCLFSVWLLKSHLYFNLDAALINGSYWLKLWFKFTGQYSQALQEGLIGIFKEPLSIYNSSLWTMYVELWGSFSLFILYYAIRTQYLRLIVLGFALWLTAHSDASYGFFCIFGGALSFSLYQLGKASYKNLRFNTLWMLLGGGLCLCPKSFGPGFEQLGVYLSPTWCRAIGAVLIVHFIHDSPSFKKFFSLAPLLWLGDISFSLYLVHLPILCSLGAGFIVWLNPYMQYKTLFFMAVVVSTLASFTLAVIYAKTVDAFFIRFGRRVSKGIDQYYPRNRIKHEMIQQGVDG